jgi:hypothetical protein
MRLLLLIPLAAMMLLLVAVPSGLATTEPGLIVGVDVALKPHTVTLSGKSVRRGFYVDFKVRNTTASRRSFSVAGETVAVPARKTRLLVVNFGVRGKYTYVSRLASGGAAIRGVFTVT